MKSAGRRGSLTAGDVRRAVRFWLASVYQRTMSPNPEIETDLYPGVDDGKIVGEWEYRKGTEPDDDLASPGQLRCAQSDAIIAQLVQTGLDELNRGYIMRVERAGIALATPRGDIAEVSWPDLHAWWRRNRHRAVTGAAMVLDLFSMPGRPLPACRIVIEREWAAMLADGKLDLDIAVFIGPGGERAFAGLGTIQGVGDQVLFPVGPPPIGFRFSEIGLMVSPSGDAMLRCEFSDVHEEGSAEPYELTVPWMARLRHMIGGSP